MNRRGFLSLLGAAAAAPAVVTAEPAKLPGAERIDKMIRDHYASLDAAPRYITAIDRDAGRITKPGDGPFDEGDYLFSVDRDSPTPTIEPGTLAEKWLPDEAWHEERKA